MKKAGACCLCDHASRNLQGYNNHCYWGYNNHCYWVNLCFLFVTDGSVNDGTLRENLFKIFMTKHVELT
ncbi:hypothetical protein PHAVU_002G174300 [Phaseolus vulgaris]|uniref:Uncharacterized protein n=1 Tax=Phaseolus vulgaris TaxID=3885 RepID=V7CKJ0_PHAVU|nr:hypothetical protein PHAVU_002G174300g [Phaseolus vulgaris]ESW30687.1 hypothetical protein PHAVU_002G174300g [Phaseolus vulgaris]